MNYIEKAKIRVDIFQCIKNNNLVELEKILSKKELNINEIDYDLNTPLSHAARFKNLEAMKLLVSHGADINTPCPRSKTTNLIISSRLGHIEAVEFMILNNVDINKTNLHSTSALMEAAYANKLEVVKLLVENNADIMNINRFGYNIIEMLENDKDKIDVANYLKLKLKEKKLQSEINSEIKSNNKKKELIKSKKVRKIKGFRN